MARPDGLRRLRALVAVGFVVGACGSADSPDPGVATSGPPRASSAAPGSPPETLVAAAREEGALTTIGLPHGVCNHQASLETFGTKYGIAITELDPEASPVDQVEALSAAAAAPDAAAPDVVDLTPPFGAHAARSRILQPYRVATWDAIPEVAKDPAGHWWGGYFGVVAFEVNTAVAVDVPRDWPDLLRPEYRGHVALAGDPRSSDEAADAVFAAALASGGALDDAGPGLAYFGQLRDMGNLLPQAATSTMIASGQVAIGLRWTFNALSNRDATALAGGPPIAVVVPPSGRLAAVRVQGISAHAAHPNAARLWQEFLLSDEGQQLWLAGHCHPIRFDELVASGVLGSDALDGMPDVGGAAFPTIGQTRAATEVVAAGWENAVGLTIR